MVAERSRRRQIGDERVERQFLVCVGGARVGRDAIDQPPDRRVVVEVGAVGEQIDEEPDQRLELRHDPVRDRRPDDDGRLSEYRCRSACNSARSVWNSVAPRALANRATAAARSGGG